jgi:hypothetical protein
MPITSSETSFNDRPQQWKFTKIEVFPIKPVKISMILIGFRCYLELLSLPGELPDCVGIVEGKVWL